MGRRGPQPGDIAGKVRVMVPAEKNGKRYYIPRYVTQEAASKYQQYTPGMEEQEQSTGKKRPENWKDPRLNQVYNLPPNDESRYHSHQGSLKYHPVHLPHDDDNVSIEHRNEKDAYENRYYGSKMQKPLYEQLGFDLNRSVPINMRGLRLKADKYVHPKIGNFYLFDHKGWSYVVSPANKITKHFYNKLDGEDFIFNLIRGPKKSFESKSLILDKIQKMIQAFSSYTSGNNSVRIEYNGNEYSVLVNSNPIMQSGDFGSAMSEYYRQIGEIVRLQESDPDISLNIFGDQVVRTNREAIDKLSMMGKSMEAGMLKNFDYSNVKLPFEDIIFKYESPSNQIGQVPIQEDMGQAAAETGNKPRRLDENRERKQIGSNTFELKSIDKDRAQRIGRSIGIDFDKYNLDQFTRGINVEREHGSRDPETDVIGDDPFAAGKIAWAHLKEVPDYYTKLEMVEKELRDLGMRPAPEEALQDRHRDVDRPHKVSRTFQQRNSPSEEVPMEFKDFPMMAEGVQAHESVKLEGTADKIGGKPKPIIGKSFGPMMAVDRIGDNPKPIDGRDSVGSFSTERDTTSELENQTQEQHEVEENKEPFYHKRFNTDMIYDQLEDILKSRGLIEGSQPMGVKSIGNQVEHAVYHGLRDTVNDWFSRIEPTTQLDKAVLDLKADLLKWEIGVSRDVVTDVNDIFNKGIQAGMGNTGIAVPDRLTGMFNYQMYKPTGISPALENFQNSVFDSLSGILRKHYDNGFPIYSTKRDIDSYLRKARYNTRLMIKSEVAQMANLGQIIAWEQDPDRYMYEYFWNAIDDDRIKVISKSRLDGNPYAYPEIRFLWENQIQIIDGVEYNDVFNQRCSISRGDLLSKSWDTNRFSSSVNLFKSTMI
jgi:hypothetical protein